MNAVKTQTKGKTLMEVLTKPDQFDKKHRAWKKYNIPQNYITKLCKSPVISESAKAVLRVEWKRLQIIAEPLRQEAINSNQ